MSISMTCDFIENLSIEKENKIMGWKDHLFFKLFHKVRPLMLTYEILSEGAQIEKTTF